MSASDQKIYRRLPGTGYRYLVSSWLLIPLFFVLGIFVLLLRGNRVQLWEGPDHLLLVEWSGHKERYKRFSYRDIQSFTIRKTNESLVVNIILAVIVALFAVLALAVPDVAGKILLFFVAAIFGLVLIINLFSGPRSKCFLRTAVQIEELPSLRRLRTAEKVLVRLRPHILEAQGAGVAEPHADAPGFAAAAAAMDIPPVQ